MLTYDDYFSQMMRVAKEINALLSNNFKPIVNCTGLRDTEALWKCAGVYHKYLVRFGASVDQEQQYQTLSDAIRALLQPLRADFYNVMWELFSPEDVKEDRAFLSMWQNKMGDFYRMNPFTFIGYVSMFSTKDIYPDSREGYNNWFSDQLMLLAEYCLTHDIDIAYAICQIQKESLNNVPNPVQ